MYEVCFVPSALPYAQSGATLARQLDAEDESILQRHQPFYFAYGRPTTKIQVSFKTPLVKGFPIYFGYSQLMFWKLEEDSKPFRDLTYNPELFYRLKIRRHYWLKSLDFGIFDHHSNGKGGEDSRSFDAHYVSANFEREGRRWLTRLSLKGSYLHRFDAGNSNIQRYVGPFSVGLSFVQMFDAWIDKGVFELNFFPGGKFAQNWSYGGYQLSYSFRLGKIDLVPAFYVQYYRGYAETLLNFEQNINEFRVGLVF
jgi:phospholipase A1